METKRNWTEWKLLFSCRQLQAVFGADTGSWRAANAANEDPFSSVFYFIVLTLFPFSIICCHFFAFRSFCSSYLFIQMANFYQFLHVYCFQSVYWHLFAFIIRLWSLPRIVCLCGSVEFLFSQSLLSHTHSIKIIYMNFCTFSYFIIQWFFIYFICIKRLQN